MTNEAFQAPPVRHLALQVLLTAQEVNRAANRTFKRHRLTPAQFNVLNLLSDQPQGLCASKVADLLIVDRSNVTGLLKRMKRSGLLKTVDNTRDRRKHIVVLTENGRITWQAAHPAYEQGLKSLDGSYSTAIRSLGMKILRGIAENAAAFR